MGEDDNDGFEATAELENQLIAVSLELIESYGYTVEDIVAAIESTQ